MTQGPLHGVTIVELAGIGPAPFGVMLLADLGAEILRVDRLRPAHSERFGGGLGRNRRSIAVDLKQPAGKEVLHKLLKTADVFVEGFRPGVVERLGFGPDVCMERNPQLIFARMTGWGQEGPMAQRAGHDLNFAGLAGAIFPIGEAGKPPPPPLNLVADFGGGGTYLAIGVLAALVERQRSGIGQVVDAAMIDGVSSLTAYHHGLIASGDWTDERASNRLDGAAPFYAAYGTSDEQFIAVAANEPPFYSALLATLGLDPVDWPQHDQALWPVLKTKMAKIFRGRTREYWVRLFEPVDACLTPILSLSEAPDHPHMRAREVFVETGRGIEPAPAPRLSRTPGSIRRGTPRGGQHTGDILREYGYSRSEIAELYRADVVAST